MKTKGETMEISGLKELKTRMKKTFKVSDENIEEAVKKIIEFNEGKENVYASIWTRASRMYKQDGIFAIVGTTRIKLDHYTGQGENFTGVLLVEKVYS